MFTGRAELNGYCNRSGLLWRLDPVPMTDADRDYLEAQGLEQKIADALAIVLREKPRDAAGRMAELLLPVPMAKDRVSLSCSDWRLCLLPRSAL
jgi:hypothetical protein